MKRLLLLLLLQTFPLTVLAADAAMQKEEEKEKVAGIGGLFFRAEAPQSLAGWYEEHLGISLVPSDYDQQPWIQESGPTVFAPFDKETEYFGDPANVWMINFRVRNLDRLVEQLRHSGIAVEVDPQSYPNGRFARLHDPEGNPIELWEPN